MQPPHEANSIGIPPNPSVGELPAPESSNQAAVPRLPPFTVVGSPGRDENCIERIRVLGSATLQSAASGGLQKPRRFQEQLLTLLLWNGRGSSVGGGQEFCVDGKAGPSPIGAPTLLVAKLGTDGIVAAVR
jgi:hypothetical protein